MSPGSEVAVTGELVSNRKNRIYEAKAVVQDANGRTLAEATGKYLPIKGADAAAMAADFVGDPSWLFRDGKPA
jgi:hypothetical protein